MLYAVVTGKQQHALRVKYHNCIYCFLHFKNGCTLHYIAFYILKIVAHSTILPYFQFSCLNSVSSKYFCLFCHCQKNEINDLTRKLKFPIHESSQLFLTIHDKITFLAQRIVCQHFKGLWPIQRSLEEHKNNIGKRNPKGCKHEPLLQLDAINSPPDHLHMRRAIISRLFYQVNIKNI